MSGKRVLWRDRCDERVRGRRRRQGRVLAALLDAQAEGQAAQAVADTSRDFDLASWLMLGAAGEPARPPEAPFMEP